MAKRRRPAGTIGDAPHARLALELRTMSLRAVARTYGVHPNAARYWRDQLGLAGPPRPAARGLALQPRILAYLAAHPAGATRHELAGALQDTPLMLYRTLCRLEARGQVSRTLERIGARWETQSRWHLAPDAGLEQGFPAASGA